MAPKCPVLVLHLGKLQRFCKEKISTSSNKGEGRITPEVVLQIVALVTWATKFLCSSSSSLCKRLFIFFLAHFTTQTLGEMELECACCWNVFVLYNGSHKLDSNENAVCATKMTGQ